ncbi:hypothetical protein [Nocardioides sp.]|uniref:FitA-like ribbon-helix-helix domain-containing protein n=1 Tax=Nocardioides sp. TaxID=35761 RepID=UPI0026247C08|nr:hypothetical protein [Nocardioides sp.]
MTTITVRNVPDETRDLLAARAKRAGQSMQEYLRRQLIEIGAAEDQGEFWDRVEESVARHGSTLSTEDILAALDEGRR